jgi:hypothetical protein
MRRFAVFTAALFASLMVVATPAFAGSAHFVDDQLSVSRDGDTLTAAGKIAGLGSEPQVHVVLTATAACVNPGDNKPQAANKQVLTAEGDFPIQNGKAYFVLNVTPVVDPSSPCPDPMVFVFSGVSVTAAGITVAVPGVF